MDKAQHSAGKSFLDSIALGDLPGIGMVVIDGVVRSGRSRNTPPAEKFPPSSNDLRRLTPDANGGCLYVARQRQSSMSSPAKAIRR